MAQHKMTHRERVLAALEHREPDRVPIDLGGTFATTMTMPALERLTSHLGLSIEPEVMSTRSRTMVVPDEILRRFDVDTRMIKLGGPADTPLDDGSFLDEWGVRWKAPHGGHYIDVDSPFRQVEPDIAALDKFDWPDPAHPSRTAGMREQARELRDKTDYALILNLYIFIIHYGQSIRGYENWVSDLVAYPEYCSAMLDKIEGVLQGVVGHALDAVGDLVDVVFFGDDLGYQNRPMMNPDTYRKMVKPRHKRMVDLIKSKTKAKVLFHTDGDVYPLIPDLIDAGVDILNPIQISAAEMSDTARLKREFGDRLSFWGAIDTHDALRGSTKDVRNEVRRRVTDLATGGGYVLGSVHNIQADVPPENVIAMFEAAQEFGRYPVHA